MTDKHGLGADIFRDIDLQGQGGISSGLRIVNQIGWTDTETDFTGGIVSQDIKGGLITTERKPITRETGTITITFYSGIQNVDPGSTEKFIGGVPRNPATNLLIGCLNSASGVPSC